MRHGSLFSGIGGFDLAAAWMGWENVFHCERDPFCRQVLQHYWPEAGHHDDIWQFNARKYRGLVDIISGGFPCQPFSTAGQRKGTQDDRYLWPEARRVIEQARPRWIVLENVAGLFTILEPAGLSEMEIKAVELFCADDTVAASETIVRLQQRVMGSIVKEIQAAGYVLPQLTDGTPVVLCVPACAVNAPHRRDRVWFVAHADDTGNWPDTDQPRQRHPDRNTQPAGPEATTVDSGRGNPAGGGERNLTQDYTDAANSHTRRVGTTGIPGAAGQPAWGAAIPGWAGWPAQPLVCGGNDGIPRSLDGFTFPKWRVESIKAFGNAIVPQVALEIFSTIQQIENESRSGRKSVT